MKLSKESLIIIAVAVIIVVVAAVGFFAFSGGQQEVVYEPYQFYGCTFDLPENVSMLTEFNDTSSGGVEIDTYGFNYVSNNRNISEYNESFYVELEIAHGGNIISSVSDYVKNVAEEGAVQEGTYGDWTIINIENYNSTYNYPGKYFLVREDGSAFYNLCGDDLDILKEIADSFKSSSSN